MSREETLGTSAASPTQQCRRIVSSHRAVFSEAPRNTPSNTAVDGPLLGNGDFLVALGGVPEKQHLFLGKNDLWRLQHGNGNASPVPFGHLSMAIPALEGASYKVCQDLYSATTTGIFEGEKTTVRIRCYVAAARNLLVLELTATGRPAKVTLSLEVAQGRGAQTAAGRAGDVSWVKRAFTQNVDIPTGAAVAFRTLAGTPHSCPRQS